jgi:hypothetical protein
MADNAFTHLIRHNGKELARGKSDLKVVFNNLYGRNFKNRMPWQSQTHQEYLDAMAVQLQASFKEGDTFELVRLADNEVERTATLEIVP